MGFTLTQQIKTSSSLVHDLKSRVDLRDLAQSLLGAADSIAAGKPYIRFRAPERKERTPSLTVWEHNFMDFGNPAHKGDVFDFLSIYAGLSFKEAVAFLQEHYASPAWRRNRIATRREIPSHARLEPPPEESPHKEQWQREVQHKLTMFQNNLWNTPQGKLALRYLSEQGYTHAMILASGLGFNPLWLKMDWKKPDGGDAWIAPGIIYPWVQEGFIYGLKVRCPYQSKNQPDRLSQLIGIAPQHSKYMQLAGGNIRASWYGNLSGDPAQPVIICEGEKDRDNLAHRLGDLASVITLGSASGHLPHTLREQLHKKQRVILMLDNDEAGKINAMRLAGLLRTTNTLTVTIKAPPSPHKDITDWLLVEKSDEIVRVLIFDEVDSLCDASEQPTLRHTQVTPSQPQSTGTLSEERKKHFFTNGVPDTLREVLLTLHTLGNTSRRYTQDHSPSALVLDLIQEALSLEPVLDNASQCIPETGIGNISIHLLSRSAKLTQRNCSEKTIRKGIEQLCGLGFLELIPDSTPLESNNISKPKGDEKGKNSKRGRPAQLFRLVPLAEALVLATERIILRLRESIFADEIPDTSEKTWFDGLTADGEALFSPEESCRLAEVTNSLSAALYAKTQTQRTQLEAQFAVLADSLRRKLDWRTLQKSFSTPLLPDKAYPNGRAYRDVYYLSRVKAAEGRQISRREAAEEVGVNEKTLVRIRRRTGVVTETQFLEFSVCTATNLAAEADRLAPWAARRRFGRYLRSNDGRRIRLDVEDIRRAEAWVKSILDKGGEVFLQVQVASRERIAVSDGDVSGVEADHTTASPVQNKRPRGVPVRRRQATPSAEVRCQPYLCCAYLRDQFTLRLEALLPQLKNDLLLCRLLEALDLMEIVPFEAMPAQVLLENIIRHDDLLRFAVEELGAEVTFAEGWS